MVRGPALLLSLVVATGCGRTAIYGGFGGDEGIGEAGDPDDDEPPGPVDCDKVDFLFVIDNSGSMYDHQVNLIENFEVITAGVDRVIEGRTDLHVGVVSTDIYAGNPFECQTIGGLVNHPSGAHSSDRECGPWAAGRYMTNADDIDDGFACAAQLGTTGSTIERPMDAMLAAIEDDGPASECNAGFLRDDALLVTVVVTDEWDGPGDPEDDGSWTGPELWTRGLVDAKGSDASYAVVMLVNEERGQCRPGHVEHDGHVLAEWAESQPFGFVGSICGDYGESFSQAVDVVAAACAGE
ncbi:MAG TPA: hypothetical protein VG755_35400 [Nannocystaceae bacterium]|nr:hypothetical protein [Nannocystaceae bacterium]